MRLRPLGHRSNFRFLAARHEGRKSPRGGLRSRLFPRHARAGVAQSVCGHSAGALRPDARRPRRRAPRQAIASLADEIDARAARALWEAAAAAPGPAAQVWLHGDLKADNLIARAGALAGVIDWGLAAVGDPAADHAAAWTWVDPAARDIFRAALDLGAADPLRAQGWALHGAAIALAFYRGGGNDALCRQSRRMRARLGLMG